MVSVNKQIDNLSRIDSLGAPIKTSISIYSTQHQQLFICYRSAAWKMTVEVNSMKSDAFNHCKTCWNDSNVRLYFSTMTKTTKDLFLCPTPKYRRFLYLQTKDIPQNCSAIRFGYDRCVDRDTLVLHIWILSMFPWSHDLKAIWDIFFDQDQCEEWSWEILFVFTAWLSYNNGQWQWNLIAFTCLSIGFNMTSGVLMLDLETVALIEAIRLTWLPEMHWK